MSYLCSEKKDADQLCSYPAAGVHLCFCICKKASFVMTQLILIEVQEIKQQVEC